MMGIKSFRLASISAALLLASALLANAADPSIDAEAYYKGKTIRLLVDTSPGGGTDLLARYFAIHLGKFIPGNPRIIVTNYPNSVAAMNYMTKIKPDGLTLIYSPRPRIPEQYSEQADFRVVDFQYIGGVHKSGGVWMIKGDVPYKNIKDASGGKYVLTIPITPDPQVAVTQWNQIGLLLAAEALNLPVKAIPLTSAERGTTAQLLGLERGDFNGFMQGAHVWKLIPSLRPGWTAKGFIKPFAFVGTPEMSMEPNKESPITAPNMYELVDPKYRKLMDAFVMAGAIPGKHFAAPPGLPKSLLQVLRTAYKKAMTDKEFRQNYNRIAHEDPPLIDGETYEAEVKKFAQALQENKGLITTKLKDLYEKYSKR